MDFFAMFLSKSYKIFLSKIIFLTYISSRYFDLLFHIIVLFHRHGRQNNDPQRHVQPNLWNL